MATKQMKLKRDMSFYIFLALVVFAVLLFVFGTKAVFTHTAQKKLSSAAEFELLEFDSNLSKEMKLALQMAKSPLVVSYFQNPEDENLFELARTEIAAYQSSFLSNGTFWINDKDLNYYINGEAQYVLDKNADDSDWYRYTMAIPGDYGFNVNYEKSLRKTFLWLNAIVRDKNRNAIGLAGTGIPLTDFINIMYSKLEKGITMYLYDADGKISGAQDVSLLESTPPIEEIFPELSEQELKPKSASFVSTMKGEYRIVPIESVNWYMVLFEPFNITSFLQNCAPIVVALLLVFILYFAFVIVQRIFVPIRLINSIIAEISSGKADLSKRIEMGNSGTTKFVRELILNFNSFTEKLHGIISNVKDSKNFLEHAEIEMNKSMEKNSASIDDIGTSISSLGSYIDGQVQSVNETSRAIDEITTNIGAFDRVLKDEASEIAQASAAVTEMIENISAVNSSVGELASSFNALEETTSVGVQRQKDLNARIERIRTQSEMLNNANSAISSIARQTNLLAMNAAIQAAHAGAAGRGFSVVADEIRKLSETSSAESKTIKKQLEEIQNSIDEIVEVSSGTQKALASVASSIKETDGLAQQINSAITEQEEGSKQIGEVLTKMNEASDEVRTASAEIKAGSQSILREIKKLKESASAMKGGMEKMEESTKTMEEQGSSLSSLYSEMNNSIKKISGEIELFTV